MAGSAALKICCRTVGNGIIDRISSQTLSVARSGRLDLKKNDCLLRSLARGRLRRSSDLRLCERLSFLCRPGNDLVADRSARLQPCGENEKDSSAISGAGQS